MPRQKHASSSFLQKHIEQTVWSSVASLIAGHVIEYTESWVSRALFKKGTVVLVESSWRSVSGGRGVEDKTMGMIIFRSFSILPSHSAVGMSETCYHYYLRRLKRYHIFNISQGVYEVLLCWRIQTNQIGTMYEPFSCCIWSFVNAELQILLISMLIFTFVLSMLLRWIILKHSAIWKSATSDFYRSRR